MEEAKTFVHGDELPPVWGTMLQAVHSRVKEATVVCNHRDFLDLGSRAATTMTLRGKYAEPSRLLLLEGLLKLGFLQQCPLLLVRGVLEDARLLLDCCLSQNCCLQIDRSLVQ